VGAAHFYVSLQMLTLAEVLDDAAALEEFRAVSAVSVNSKGETGLTPLHWMATLGDLVAIELLIAAGANIDAADDQGNTPLHEAVSSRHTSAVLLFLERGASVTVKNMSGLSPRDLAQSHGYVSILEVFDHAG
jgi:uncharacterized protein